jgi:membrane associated rhomboid family serine protease
MNTYLSHLFQTMPATLLLMSAMLLCSLMGFRNNVLYLKMIHHPASMTRDKEYYRLLSSDFVHNDYIHLLVNEAMAFFICGNLEEILKMESVYGSIEFMFIYLFSHFSGIFVTTLRHVHHFHYSSAGASGSILGCMMGFMILRPNFIGFYLPVVGGVKNIYVGLIVIMGLIIYQRRTGNPVMDNELHFYSALGGIVATFILFPHLLGII